MDKNQANIRTLFIITFLLLAGNLFMSFSIFILNTKVENIQISEKIRDTDTQLLIRILSERISKIELKKD